MDPFVVTVKYLVTEARDGSDAVHRASEYQCAGEYYDVVQELDCQTQQVTPENMFEFGFNVADLTDMGFDVQHGEIPGSVVIDGKEYYSASWK